MGELYHHGILGMKWGVRRFRNTDGTLTDAGKKRYSDSGEGRSENGVSESRRWKKNDAKFLDDAELNARVNRLTKEAQYRQLIDKYDESRQSALSKYTKSFLNSVANKSIEALANKVTNSMFKSGGNNDGGNSGGGNSGGGNANKKKKKITAGGPQNNGGSNNSSSSNSSTSYKQPDWGNPFLKKSTRRQRNSWTRNQSSATQQLWKGVGKPTYSQKWFNNKWTWY